MIMGWLEFAARFYVRVIDNPGEIHIYTLVYKCHTNNRNVPDAKASLIFLPRTCPRMLFATPFATPFAERITG